CACAGDGGSAIARSAEVWRGKGVQPAACTTVFPVWWRSHWRPLPARMKTAKSRTPKALGDRKVQLETNAKAFVALVGERVREARERRGISRRALSELSQVSLRYLAHLEGGTGNISIALLWRVSEALDHRIEWLVGADDPWKSEMVRCSELFRRATRE